MKESLLSGSTKVKIVVVGDLFVAPERLEKAALRLPYKQKDIIKILWKLKSKEDFQRKILNIERNGPESESFPEQLLHEIKDADILLVHFAPIPKIVIESAKKLKLIGICRGGVENIDMNAANENEIVVIHVVRNAEAVAEFTIGLILCETRNIARSHEALKRGFWRKDFANSKFLSTLKGKAIGIVGLGHIGKLIVKKLESFDVHLLGYDERISEREIKASGIKIEMVDLEYLFRESDIVTLHLRLVPETEGIINKNLISLMKPTSYIINTARAGLIEEKALYDALKKNKIAGAALDVYWEEPLSPKHPIIKLDNVTLTSHLAGTTVDAIPNSPFLLIEAINEYLKKGSSSFVVNNK